MVLSTLRKRERHKAVSSHRCWRTSISMNLTPGGTGIGAILLKTRSAGEERKAEEMELEKVVCCTGGMQMISSC